MVYTPSADGLQLLRVILDTPSHEGNERVRAEISGDPGGDWGREDGLGGGRPVAGEPANGSRVAGPVRAGGTGRTGGPVAPTGELPPPDVGRGRGDGARAAAITARTGGRGGWRRSWCANGWRRRRRSRQSTAAWSALESSTRCAGTAGARHGSAGSEPGRWSSGRWTWSEAFSWPTGPPPKP